MTNKQTSQENIIRMLKEAKEKGYIGNLPDDPADLQTLARTIQSEMVYYQQLSEGETGWPGQQQLVLKLNPSGAWNASTDRTLPIYFEGPEWFALFYDVLRATDRESRVADEDFAEWQERQSVRFQKSIAEYPMLGKIWDTYIDVRYQPEEIPQLRDECQRVKASTSNAVALRGLDKLIAACDQALKDSLGLSLLSE